MLEHFHILLVVLSTERSSCAGTSPLYVFPNIFASEPSKDDVLGAMSLIFWFLSIVVLIKYVAIVLHANDNGEGKSHACKPPASHAHPSWFAGL